MVKRVLFIAVALVLTLAISTGTMAFASNSDVAVIKSATYEIVGEKIVFTVVTSAGDYNRMKVTTTDNLGGSLGVSNVYTVDANGDFVWTIKADAPTATTTYAFDLRSSVTGKYIKKYYTTEVEYQDQVIFKSTSYEIKDGKVILSVVTSAGDYNRVKVALLDNITSYVKYVDTYNVNADGDYVWTLKFNAPDIVTDYALDIRVATTKKYVKDYYYITINPIVEEPEADTVYISANGEINNGKLSVTIVTKPAAINRVKLMLTSDQSSYVKLIDKYTVDANGNYVWTATVTAPSDETSYTCDVRSTETNRYMKNFYTFEVASAVELYKSVSYEIDNGKIVFTVVTSAGNYNRIKLAVAADTKTSLAVGTYTVDANGDYVWTVKTDAPTATTTYAFDLRTTENKYLKDYHNYEVVIAENVEIYKSVSYEIVDEKIIFTVVTSAGDYNRIKVTTADALGGSLGVSNSYIVDANGDYVWTVKAAAPTATTTYAFDLRNATTVKYLKDYYMTDVEVAEQITEPIIFVSNASGNAGDEVAIMFDMVNSPALYAMSLKIAYDDTALTLVSAESGEAMNSFVYTAPGRLKNGSNFMWYANDPATTDGTVLRLVFRINDGAAAGTYPITMTCDSNNTYDANDNDVSVKFVDGGIVVNN